MRQASYNPASRFFIIPYVLNICEFLSVQAQGLLKTATSTGQSKEARLARVSSNLRLVISYNVVVMILCF